MVRRREAVVIAGTKEVDMPSRVYSASLVLSVLFGACGGVASPTAPVTPSLAVTPAAVTPPPTTAPTQGATPTPEPTPPPKKIGALVDEVFEGAKSGGFTKMTTAEVEATIAAAMVADPATASWQPSSYGVHLERSISSLFQNTDGSATLRGCEAEYDNSFYGGPNEEITMACAEVAEYLYIAYSRNQQPAFVAAFSDFINYLKTRIDLNGRHKAADEIIGLVRDCIRFAGDGFRICDQIWYP